MYFSDLCQHNPIPGPETGVLYKQMSLLYKYKLPLASKIYFQKCHWSSEKKKEKIFNGTQKYAALK